MKLLKKSISLLIVLTMVAVMLASCSGGEQPAATPTPAATEEATAEPTEEATEEPEEEATAEPTEEATEEPEEEATAEPTEEATEEPEEEATAEPTEEATEEPEEEATAEATEEAASAAAKVAATDEATEEPEEEATAEATEEATEEPEATAEATEEATAEATEEAAEPVGELTITDTLIMGTNAEFAPFEFVGDDGTVQGIDAEIAAEIAKDLGVELEISNMNFDSLLPALASGKIDIAIAGMTVTEERKQTTTFSDPYFNATQVIIVPSENSTVASVEDLAGKKIGVQLGTTGDLYTDDLEDVTVTRYNKGLDAVMDLAAGRLDCVIIDLLPARSFVANVEGVEILELDEDLTQEEYAIAVKSDDPALLAAINDTLERIKTDGTLDAILDKYADMTTVDGEEADAEATAETTEEPAAEATAEDSEEPAAEATEEPAAEATAEATEEPAA